MCLFKLSKIDYFEKGTWLAYKKIVTINDRERKKSDLKSSPKKEVFNKVAKHKSTYVIL